MTCARTKGPVPRIRQASRSIADRADGRGQIGLVDDQKIGLGDSGPALLGHLISAGHIDHIDRVIGQLPAEMGGKVVAAWIFQEKELR